MGACRGVRLVARDFDTGIPDLTAYGQLDNIKAKGRPVLVPDNMIDGFVTIGYKPDVTGADRGNNRFVPRYPDSEGGMGQEDDDGIGGMDMGGGGVLCRNIPFQQSDIVVLQEDLVVGFPVDGKLGFQSCGGKKYGRKKIDYFHGLKLARHPDKHFHGH